MRLSRAATVTTVAASLLLPIATAATAAAPAAHSRAITGPDVASYQHPGGERINWHAVAKHHRFAIIKATEGTNYVNPWFHRDYRGARRAGLVHGSYHFARPAYPVAETATRQANYYVRRLGSVRTTRTLPPALDLETTGGLGPTALVDWAQTFLLRVRHLTGRTPMLYTYPSFWTYDLADPAALARWPLWMAAYSGGPNAPAVLWQYTSTARVAGIADRADLSRFLGSATAFAALANGRRSTPWPATAPGAPQLVHASVRPEQATVSWLPADSGSAPISSYTVTAHPGGAHVTVDPLAGHATLTGLTDGTAYTFTVTARNAVGRGTASAPTAPLTPVVPVAMKVLATSVTNVSYGADATVQLLLRRTDTRTPIANRQVTVAAQPAGATDWTPLPSVTTGPHGRATVTVTPQQAETVRVTFAVPGYRKVSVTVPIVVHEAVSAALSATTVPAETPVTVSGTVGPSVPGVTVRLQALDNGQWTTIAQSVTALDGAWSVLFTPPARGTETLRAKVVGSGGLATGYSPGMTLTVT